MEAKLTAKQAWHDFIERVYQPENWKTVNRKMRGQIGNAKRRFNRGTITDDGIASILIRTKPEWYRVEKKVILWKQNH